MYFILCTLYCMFCINSGAVLLPRELSREVEAHVGDALELHNSSKKCSEKCSEKRRCGCCIPRGLAEFISHREVGRGVDVCIGICVLVYVYM